MAVWDDFASVIFDVDGVLIDTMGFHAEAWVRAGNELGIEVDEMEVYRREGEPGRKTAKDFLKMAGMMTTKARARAFVEKKEEVYKVIASDPKLFPGVKDVLETLSGRGLKLGFVTGTSREEIKQTLPEELFPFFKVSVCGDEVLRGKPNPEPYLKGLSLLGISPGEALVIENAPFGIRSAKTAGIAVWAVRSYLSDEDLRDADRLFDSLKAIPWDR